MNKTIEVYLTHARFERSISSATVNTYVRTLAQYEKLALQLNSKVKYDNKTCRNFFIELRKRGNGEKTLLGRYQVLQVFFKWLVRNGYVKENPMNGIEKPHPPVKLPVFLDEDECKRLFKWLYARKKMHPHMKLRDIAIMGLFIFCGLRRKELLNLKMRNISMSEGYIKIVEAKMGKERFIPLNDTARTMLQAYLKVRPTYDMCDNVFVTGENYKMEVGVQLLHKLFREINALKWNKHICCHTLRHTFCSLLIRGGVNFRDVQMLAGHADVSTTLKFYVGVDERSLRRAVDSHPLNIAF